MWGYVSHPNFPTKFLRTYFFKNSPGIFRVFSLPLKIPDKNKPWPLETPQIVLHSSEILRPKNQDPWNHFTWFFLDHAWKYHGLVLMFLVNVNIKILFFNVYINRETSAPDQKKFSTIRSSRVYEMRDLIPANIGLFQKKKIRD